jgi:hypothetical protein
MTISSLPTPLRVLLIVLTSLAAFWLSGCDSPTGTIREIRKNLDTFKKTPNMDTLARLDKSFTKIDTQIKAFEAKQDAVQADLFRRQAMTMRYEYLATRMAFLKWCEEQSAKPQPSAPIPKGTAP